MLKKKDMRQVSINTGGSVGVFGSIGDETNPFEHECMNVMKCEILL